MNIRNMLLTFTSIVTLSACATIIEGEGQSIALKTSSNQPAMCQLSNERGSWRAQAPSTVEVKRSVSRLNVACRDHYQTGQIEERATVNPWYFGNILIGGLVGLVIDPITGAMAAYEDNITVPMGYASNAARPTIPATTSHSPAAPAANATQLPAITDNSRKRRWVRPTLPAPTR